MKTIIIYVTDFKIMKTERMQLFTTAEQLNFDKMQQKNQTLQNKAGNKTADEFICKSPSSVNIFTVKMKYKNILQYGLFVGLPLLFVLIDFYKVANECKSPDFDFVSHNFSMLFLAC